MGGGALLCGLLMAWVDRLLTELRNNYNPLKILIPQMFSSTFESNFIPNWWL